MYIRLAAEKASTYGRMLGTKPTAAYAINAPDVMAEHSGREGPLAHDEPAVRGRLLDLACHHGPEREIAERTVRVPALEAGIVLDERRPGAGIEALERLEPGDARVPVAELAVPLRVVEVLPQRPGVAGVEAERPETAQCLVTPHGD